MANTLTITLVSVILLCLSKDGARTVSYSINGQGGRYDLGWRGGKWYANRKFRKEQMKLLEQIKPKRWQLKFLRRPLIRSKSSENAVKPSEAFQKDLPVAHNSGEMNRPC
ncbi:hypothetical protein ACSBR2_027771 [Camellia fascicularis]